MMTPSFFHSKVNVLFIGTLMLLVLSACGVDKNKAFHLHGKTMGTTYNIKYTGQNIQLTQQEMQAEIDRRLEEVNDQMSTYRPTSELSLFNQQEAGVKFDVSPALITVVQEAVRLNKLTLGAVDVTVGPLVNLWGFGPEARPEMVPTEEQIKEKKAVIGVDKFSLGNHSLTKHVAGLYVDLSTIAKGYGVDVVVDYVESLGIENYMVEIGGELKVKGKNAQGVAWRIAIEKPDQVGHSMQKVIEPNGMAVATSGDYRNFFEKEGVRYSHIIDPKTGKPIQHKVASITVLAPSCMTADGLATGLMVLGEEKGLEIANQHNIPAYMLVKENNGFKAVYSKAFEQYLK